MIRIARQGERDGWLVRTARQDETSFSFKLEGVEPYQRVPLDCSVFPGSVFKQLLF
jgi:hypothetical protein